MKVKWPDGEQGRKWMNRTLARPESGVLRVLDVNTASLDELCLLRGVGKITAQRIIDGRPYEDVSQLVSRGVLTESRYKRNSQSLAVAVRQRT